MGQELSLKIGVIIKVVVRVTQVYDRWLSDWWRIVGVDDCSRLERGCR
jgi:hypothetical protein